MTGDEARAHIAALLSAERSELDRFAELLDQEHALLTGRDIDALIPLAERKNAACAALSRAARVRAQAFAQLGIGPGKDAVAATLSRIGAPLPERWAELLAGAARAREANERNGVLIRSLMQHNQQALAVLMAASDAGSVYGPDGQPRATPSGRILGSA